MMKSRLLIILLLMLLMSFAVPALAQDGDGDGVPDATDPCPTVPGAGNGCPSGGAISYTNSIFYLDDGLIKQWNPVTGQVDWGATYEFNETPVLSPLGHALAYNSWASDAGEMRSAFLNNTYAGQFFGPLISNIWYYDLNESTRIAAQPSGAFMTPTEAMGTVRSEPVWSPDARYLAWTQLQLPSYGYQLVIHDTATGTQTIPVPQLDPGFWDVSFHMHTPRWSTAGISIVTVQMGGGGVQYVLDVYDPVTGAQSRYYLPFEPVIDHVWLNGDDSRVVFLQDTQWQIYYTLSEKVQSSSSLVRYSLNNPRGVKLHATPASTSMNWQAIAPDGTVLETFSTDLRGLDHVAISPDGNSYAYINNGNLYVRVGGETQLIDSASGLTTNTGIPLSSGLTWGPMGWMEP